MAEQVSPATATGMAVGAGGPDGSAGTEAVPFVSQVPGTPVHFPSYHGRTVSWVAVALILVGFLVGGLSLVFGPTWWVFWLGLAIVVVGGLIAMSSGIQNDWY
jgi:hypothetical protein